MCSSDLEITTKTPITSLGDSDAKKLIDYVLLKTNKDGLTYHVYDLNSDNKITVSDEFLLLGKKGKIIALLLGGIFKVVDGLLDKFAGINQEIADQENKTTNLGGLYEKIQDELNRIKDLQEKFNSELEKTKGKANDVSNIFEKIFRNVYTLNENNIAGFLKVEDVATSINKVFGDFSKSIAEIIVLGKSVTTTFKEFLQGILVQIVASSIEYLLRDRKSTRLNSSH